ncbi:hypothetical protein GCM10028895_46340 [Pontibacter rugosus]
MRAGREISFYENMIKYSLDMICSIDRNGCFVYVSDACHSILGYAREEMEGHYYLEYIQQVEQERVRQVAEDTLAGYETTSFECSCLHKDGYLVPVLWAMVWSEDDGVAFCTGRDITEQTRAKEKLREKEDLHSAFIEHGSDMLALFDEQGTYLYNSGATLRDLGYEPESLIGRNAFEYAHPDDTHALMQNHALLLSEAGKVVKQNFRYRSATGEWRWIEATCNNQLHNPHVKALITNSRDITESRNYEQKIIESEQQFKALFDNNPEVVIIENLQGVILDINYAGELLVGLRKEDIVGQHLANFLNPEAAGICLKYLQLASEGQTLQFDVEMVHNQEMLILSITKIPVIVEGKVIKVHSVIRDITALTQSHRIVREQAKKLNTILGSIKDAFCILDKNWIYTYTNSEFEKLLGVYQRDMIGENIWDHMPGGTNSVYYQHYSYAMESGKTVSFEVYSPELKLWLHLKAFPSEEGLLIYFNDITDKVEVRQKLEKLSLVASKTTNGIIITDVDGVAEWVNEGFTNLTGYTFAETVGVKVRSLIHGEETDQRIAATIEEKRRQGVPCTEEILIYNKAGEKRWVLLDCSPVRDDAGNITRSILIQTDITDKVKSQKELEKLSLVASNTTNGVIITDPERRIEWVNKGFVTLTGYSLEDAKGKRPSELLHNPRATTNEFELVKDQMLRGEPVAFEKLNSRKNGEEIWLSMQVNPIFDDQGKLIQYITTQTDITALKKSELELSELTKDLYRHNRDLQQFTYIVSHNLRAPVANILGLTNMLAKLDRTTNVYDKTLDNLIVSTQRLDYILKDLNEILSIRDNKLTLEKEKVDLKSKWQQVIDSLREPLQACGGEITLDIKDGTSVNGNSAYLYSIFYNLLSNAIKYRAAERPLQIGVKLYGSTKLGTFISLTDNGTGFDMKLAGNDMFKLYKRFHASAEGRGIGLFLTKTHLEAMGEISK